MMYSTARITQIRDTRRKIRLTRFRVSAENRRTGMIREAAERYNIDLAGSWMIGDTTMDIQTGINAGMRTALVQTGEAGNDKKYDVKPDLACKDLLDAVEKILQID